MERLRRLRKSAAIRDMVRENHVRVEELIYPLFVADGTDRVEPIASMPGICQYTLDRLPEELNRVTTSGVKAVILFGIPANKGTAVERGFGFECDIYLSKDKRLFAFHDAKLMRTTGGANTNRCTDVTWDGALAQVNVGGWGKWKGSKFDPTRPASRR